MKIQLFIYTLLVLLLISCSREFKAEKVEDNIQYTNKYGSELYLVKNYPKDVETREMLFFGFAKQHMRNLCKLDSSILVYIVFFYEDCSLTRRYISNSKKYEREHNRIYPESIYDICEDCYVGDFLYERSKENHNVWYLTDSEEERFKDTIYCK